MNHPTERILILDFGSQVTQLIARRVREMHVYCEILPCDCSDEKIHAFAPSGIILSGSHASVHAGELHAPALVFSLGVPVLGICYGMQTMAAQLGGSVHASQAREFGHTQIQLQNRSALLDGLATDQQLAVWMSHGDSVQTLPPGFQVEASTPSCPIAAMGDEKRRFWGLQFHPEVTHTAQGTEILRRFVRQICQCHGQWQMKSYRQDVIAQIRAQVGSDQVLLGLSGGVDSSVAAALIHQAIGDQLICVFVDHGLLRQNEAQMVMETFAQHLGVNVKHVNAAKHFLQQLENVSDPEAKRKIIGREFVHLFQEEAAKLSGVRWLAQGTIYPDVIESAAVGNKKATIKSHHNVGGLPETLHLQLLEPLRELFKDEVRELGLELGLPREMVWRHPFPGPGLGVRILGAVKEEYAAILRQADAIFIEELRNSFDSDGQSWYDKTSQAFAVFLPVKSVGVMGDGRTYEWVIALRAVITSDFMTATWAPLPHDLLARASNRIINQVKGVNRVTYDISSKPPATIEWE